MSASLLEECFQLRGRQPPLQGSSVFGLLPQSQVLVLHGADDHFVPESEVASFEKEMKDAKVNYRLIKYPKAVHGFTNPANTGESKGALYNKEADAKSWAEMQRFFKEIFE